MSDTTETEVVVPVTTEAAAATATGEPDVTRATNELDAPSETANEPDVPKETSEPIAEMMGEPDVGYENETPSEIAENIDDAEIATVSNEAPSEIAAVSNETPSEIAENIDDAEIAENIIDEGEIDEIAEITENVDDGEIGEIGDDAVTLRCSPNGHGSDSMSPNPNQCLCIPLGELRRLGVTLDLDVWVDGAWVRVRGKMHKSMLCLNGDGDRSLSLKHGDRRTIVARAPRSMEQRHD